MKKKEITFFYRKLKTNIRLILYVFFCCCIENNDDDISKMATDELIRLQTNLNSIDNEVNKDYFLHLIDLFIINRRF